MKFSNSCGHTSVCQTGVFSPQWPHHGLSDRDFLPTHFAPGCQRPYHSLTDRIFFNTSGHTTVCQTVFFCFFLILDLDVNDHNMVSQTNNVEKVKEKNTVCETVVWPLTLKKTGPWDRGMVTGGPGEKPEWRRLLFIKTSHYWWRMKAGVKIVTFWIALNTMVRNGKGRIQFFSVWSPCQERQLNSPPSVPRHHICGNLEGNNFNAGVHGPSIKGNFDGRWTPAFRFLTQASSDHTLVSRTSFF